MPDTTMSTMMAEADKRGLIRKIQRAVAFLALPTVDLPETLTGSTSVLQTLPVGYLPIGMVTRDGYTFGSEVEKEDVEALGYAGFVRSDITRSTKSITLTPLEFGRRHMLELQTGMDLSNVAQAASGEIVIDEPELPVGQEYRLVVIGADGPATNQWILGRGYPAVKLASVGDQQWGGDTPIQNELTFDVFTDEGTGTPVRHYIGGTGALAAAATLGFTQAP